MDKRVFGRVGGVEYKIDYTGGQAPDGYVAMDGERPTATAIATAQGVWEEPKVTATQLKGIVTAFRWEVETGGITLPTGARVATGIDDQNRITSVVANAERAGLEQVDFKAEQGWVSVTLVELQAIATAVALHVQACFSAERAHHEAIDALALIEDPQERQAALDGYDKAQGWPTVAPQ